MVFNLSWMFQAWQKLDLSPASFQDVICLLQMKTRVPFASRLKGRIMWGVVFFFMLLLDTCFLAHQSFCTVLWAKQIHGLSSIVMWELSFRLQAYHIHASGDLGTKHL